MANPERVAEKSRMVDEKADAIGSSAFFALVAGGGVDATSENGFRRGLREAGGDFSIMKNTLMRRVIDRLEVDEDAKSALTAAADGPTAHVVVEGNPFPVLKTLSDFTKEKQGAFEIKAGLLDGSLVAGERLSRLAKIQDVSQLHNEIVGVLQAPLAQMAGVLETVAGDLVWTLKEIQRKQAQ